MGYEFLFYLSLFSLGVTAGVHMRAYKKYTTAIHDLYNSMYERQRTLDKLITTVSHLNTDLLQVKGDVKILKGKLNSEQKQSNPFYHDSVPRSDLSELLGKPKTPV